MATESSRPLVRPFDRYGRLEWVAVALAVLTGLIHVYLGVTRGVPPFTVAGVGFFLGVAVFLTRYWRRAFYLVAAVFAAVQVLLWVLGGMRFFQVGVVDKLVQVALVAVALALYRSG